MHRLGAIGIGMGGIALFVSVTHASEPSPQNDVQVRPHASGYSGDWPLFYTVDSGREGADLAPGALAYNGSKSVRYVTWRRGMVRWVSRASVRDPLTRDFMEGEDAVLVLAADSTSSPVRCVLTLGDGDVPRGPVHILVGDREVVPSVTTQAGEFIDVEFLAVPSKSRVEIHLAGERCASFALCAASVYGQVSRRLFELPGVCGTPSLTTSSGSGNTATSKEAMEALRRYTAYLTTHRPIEGCYAYSGNWYESAYALRALLVGAKLLRMPQYRSNAFECLDRFVEEQREDGSGSAQYFGRKDCSLARETRDGSGSRNLADVGTMALTLCVAAPEADPRRHQSYLRAAVRFADTMVLPNQLPSGAFPNLEFNDRMHRHPYSVATGVQAANLAALYAVSGEPRYMEAASRAARFLCRGIVDDGRIVFYPFDSDQATLLDPGALGEIFYLLEGLIWVERYADIRTRREIQLALDRYFESPWGITSWPDPGEWLSADTLWDSSKRAGFLFLASQYLNIKRKSQIVDWTRRDLTAMCDSAVVSNIGVLSDPAGPEGRHALFATGLAGLGMASVVDPSVFFPLKDHRRP